MKTILVPTDFSKCANNAMKYALEIAEPSGQSITVLYVVYPNEGVDNNMYDAFFIDNYIQERLDAMKTWVKRFTRSPHLKNIQVTIECRIGFPVSTITQTATELGVSLIVMGTTGASGLRGVLLGSVAGGVISASKTPVFVVPVKAVFRNTARFAFATDFKLSVSKTSMQVMREMLYLQHTGLNIVHVVSEEGKKPDLRDEQALSEKLGTIPHNFHYLHDKNVVHAIHNFLESTDCNGLVAVVHEHSLLHKLFAKSVSRSLAHQTKVPILVLHDV
ncbi:MAG: universal stress protein [Phycisphaerae bacterium]|nr:universal stress protein [Saprospiraceae bacterium]